MYIFQISGGLGNQLFQYLQSKNLERKLNIKFLYNKNFYKEKIPLLDKRKPELEYINNVNISWYSSPVIDNYYAIPSGIKRKLFYLMNLLFFWRNGSFLFLNDKTLKLGWFLRIFFDDIIFIGHWQNQFKREIHQKFLLEFRPKNINKLGLNLTKILHQIQKDSIGVFVRRGDYVRLGIAKSASYYKNAILKLIERKKPVMIAIFSDDIEWCKANLKIDRHKTFFIGNSLDSSVDTLFVMSKFKIVIVSDSTFHFFAYHIGNNFKEKEIIYPKTSRIFRLNDM